MNRIATARQNRAKHVESAQQILTKIESEQRMLTPDERETLQRHISAAEELGKQIEAWEHESAIMRSRAHTHSLTEFPSQRIRFSPWSV